MLRIIDLGYPATLELAIHSSAETWMDYVNSAFAPNLRTYVGSEPYFVSLEPHRRPGSDNGTLRIGIALDHGKTLWAFTDQEHKTLAVAWGFEFLLQKWVSGVELLHVVFPGPVLGISVLQDPLRILVMTDIDIRIYDAKGATIATHPVDQLVQWRLIDAELTYEDAEGVVHSVTVE